MVELGDRSIGDFGDVCSLFLVKSAGDAVLTLESGEASLVALLEIMSRGRFLVVTLVVAMESWTRVLELSLEIDLSVSSPSSNFRKAK